MSIKLNSAYPTQNNVGLGFGKTLPTVAQTNTPWVRNPSWLTLNAPLATDQKFVGLHAVYPGDGTGNGGNFIALSAAGNYTVDWGDGSAPQNFASGVVAEYEFDYNNANLAGTNAPVTFTDSTDTVNRTAHGYTNGMMVWFYNIVTTTGLSENTPYFVVNATANTFQVSLTAGGSAIALTNDGSATLLPYKQVIVTVTPQSGQSLTAINLNRRHSSLSVAYVSGFLDIALASPLLNDLRIATSSPGSTAQNILFTNLQQANIVSSDIKTADYLFYLCTNLCSIINLATSTANAFTLPVTFTDAGDVVNAANHGLVNGNPVVLTSLTSTTGITVGTRYFVISATTNTFQISTSYGGSAVALTTDGSGSFSVGTSIQNIFNGCTSIASIPFIDATSVIDMSGMFGGCRSLKTIQLFNTSKVVSMNSMFINCSSLTSVPLFDTASVINMVTMFSGCTALKSVPLFNTASVTNMGTMFQNCSSLESVPLFNTASVTTMSSMFTSCVSLKTVPLFNTASVTTMSGMFAGCTTLKSVPLFNTVSVTNMSSMFQSCSSLESVPLFNTASVTNMNSMFSLCLSLKYVPLFNTASVTTMTSMFQNCLSLTSIPLFNTSAVTSIGNFFASCSALSSVPQLNVSAVNSSANFSNMFSSCSSLSRIQAKNFRFTFSVANCKLSSTALNEIYTNLPTVTGQTITVTGNYGTATDTPSIATAKGWTVTG